MQPCGKRIATIKMFWMIMLEVTNQNFQHCITCSDRWQSWDYVIFLMKQQSAVKVQFSKWLSQIIYRGTNSQGWSFKKWTLKAKSIRQSGRARQETKLTGKKMNPMNTTINHESNHKTQLITRTHSVKQQKTHFTFEFSVNIDSENQLPNGWCCIIWKWKCIGNRLM